MTQRRYTAGMLALIAGTAGAASGQASYELIKLGFPGAGAHPDRYSVASSVNNQGQVVGAALSDDAGQIVVRAFVWQDGVQTMLPSSVSPNEHLVSAADINEAGLICGLETLPSGQAGIPGNGQLILWNANDPKAAPRTFGQSSTEEQIYEGGTAINDNGVVVGSVALGEGIPQFPVGGVYTWTLDVEVGQFVFLVDPQNLSNRTIAHDITNQRMVTGTYADQLAFIPGLYHTAYRWVNGARVALDPQPTTAGIGFWHEGHGLNEQGIVVGSSFATGASAEPRAAKWITTERIWLQPANLPAGHHLYGATSINEGGQIVGHGTREFGQPEPPVTEPYLLENGQVIWLNDLIPAGSEFVALDQAAAINDEGWIVGTGRTSTDPNSVGFILKPVDGCYPDCNADSALTIADFACFQSKFVAADPYADCNGAGGLTIADFACFQGAFVQGCP